MKEILGKSALWWLGRVVCAEYQLDRVHALLPDSASFSRY